MQPRDKNPERPAQAQLIEARDNLRRHIEVLQAGPVRAEAGEHAYFSSQVAELSRLLAEIEAQLAESKPD